MIRPTLLVDVGGVLTTPVAGSFERFCEAEGITLAALQAVLGDIFDDHDDDHPIPMMETGKMPLPEFELWLAGILNDGLGISLAPEGLARRLVGTVSLEERMFELLTRARAAGITTVLVSNSWGDANYGEYFKDYFDAVVISGAEGVRKPDPEIFHIALERAGGIAPEHCILIDDVERNCAGARALGMSAICHSDPDTTIAELERLLGVELR